MHRRTRALLMVLACLLAIPATAVPSKKHQHPKPHIDETVGVLSNYPQRPEVRAFIDTMVRQHGFVAAELEHMFARARYNASIARLMTPSGSTQPQRWQDYRTRFVEPQRIRQGLVFWRDNAGALQHATEQYGVPPEIIVAIVGIETRYGRNPGNYRVIDALTTLSFDYPADAGDRAPFFRGQLEDYLLFARDYGLDVFAIRGSYAGAIGMPQFMPTSWRLYAVDFDGDGKIDLRQNQADAIGSVAHFLQAHGWVRDLATHYAAQLDPARLQPLLAAGIVPQFTPQQLAAFGVRPAAPLASELRLALIDLPNGEAASEYVLGTQNFYTITRYNRSSFYAMAVIELAQAIRTAYDSDRKKN